MNPCPLCEANGDPMRAIEIVKQTAEETLRYTTTDGRKFVVPVGPPMINDLRKARDNMYNHLDKMLEKSGAKDDLVKHLESYLVPGNDYSQQVFAIDALLFLTRPISNVIEIK
jgi:hypothetical protein